MKFEKYLENETATVALGKQLSSACQSGIVIFLYGDLGAGKTTLSRGFIQGLGHVGAVKSPTYTLVEPYDIQGLQIYHFDLYRLADPDELEFMGIRDYFEPGNLCLLEWPDKGGDLIPQPDLMVTMNYQGEKRVADIEAKTARGLEVIKKLN
ncbi:tRNA (adenosine(37)-N6)-threonylcarbamoyltransferase complex ATPase subunit type 1 TsaE [Algicola sagamiensis]|uniref:tRNA (adenosine(37)-N6)-threonylcarbamoyltransferase complex ATPase subunit type 1 TsaE n=1 Tax=Algicola sagamiensis TaxID=163869 RepID=UPI00036A1E81|nr:tRNA (adenosine(37)-N6)-threonylcarbamoyltransferase complex ATPase subunit type 1 TsaE [Algicola sagamiensis]